MDASTSDDFGSSAAGRHYRFLADDGEGDATSGGRARDNVANNSFNNDDLKDLPISSLGGCRGFS